MKLATRMTIIFIVISLIPVISVGYIGYHNGRRSIQKNTINRLSSINILKEAEFNRWIQSNRLYIRALAQRPLVKRFSNVICDEGLQAPDQSSAYTKLMNDHLLPGIGGSKGFIDFSILRPTDGLIVLSTREQLEQKFRENREFFKEGKKDTYVDNVYYSLNLEAMVMYISTPILDSRGELIAVLAGHVDWHEMSKIMLQSSGISASEESYLVNPFNYFVTQSRFIPDSPMTKTLYTNGVETCLAGDNGVDLYDDYRGKPVLGAYRWMDQWNLCLLTEEDQAEAFQTLVSFRNAVLGVGATVIVMVMALSFLLARWFMQRINRLVEGAHQIGGGNLGYRVRIDHRDELGLLGEALNTLARERTEAEAIINQSRDELELRVNNRTVELADANRLLMDQIEERIQTENKLQQSLTEKEVLLREIHHRVKNNLQMVQSLINLQANKLGDPDYISALNDSNNRIKSMALIHETLYRSKDMARMNLEGYFQDLTRHLHKIYKPPICRIETNFDISPVKMDIDAIIACGLVVNELATNAFKYAFTEMTHGMIQIVLKHRDGHRMAELIVSDNGVGIPEGIDAVNSDTLGLKIVAMLAEDQLNGTLEVLRDDGTVFKICFPITA